MEEGEGVDDSVDRGSSEVGSDRVDVVNTVAEGLGDSVELRVLVFGGEAVDGN